MYRFRVNVITTSRRRTAVHGLRANNFILRSMVEHKQLLAQSIFPRLNCAQYRSESTYRDVIDGMIDRRTIGGFVVFDGDVEVVESVLAELQRKAGGALLFAADCEDGVTMRFPGGTEFPSMMALGRSGDVSATYSVARSIAREMRALGIYWNFAPVADINTNPDNPIINIRAFGDSPELVADHAHAYIQAMQDGGVVACAKHFPGHGDTSVDSHNDVPVLTADRRRLDSVELLPFRTAIRNGVRSVMVSHVAVPAVDPEGRPASLSEEITGGLLRRDLGFEGVIVTDALDMHAITNAYPSGEASLLAYRAGADVLCIPADPKESFDALADAFDRKSIKVGRIKETFNRIAAMKKWCASFQDDLQQTSLTRRGHDLIALEAARRSIQVTGRMRLPAEPLLVVALVDAPENTKTDEWLRHVAAWRPDQLDAVVVTPDVADAESECVAARVDRAGAVILALFVKPRGFAGTVGLSPVQQTLVHHALARPCIVASFGNPYLLRDADVAVRIDTFSASAASLAASIEALARATK